MRIIAAFTLVLALAAALPYGTARADKLDAEQLVNDAEFTVKRMWDHPEFKDYIRTYLRRAKGVVVVPTLLKGGFIIGGEGGSGVLMARAQNNEWSYPSFVSVGSASIGLQIGGQTSELLLIIMTGRGLQAILDDQVQIGGELSGAIGPYGSSAEASTTTNLDADIIAYSISKGAFVGVNIEGTALVPRGSYIRSYYGQSVSPHAVVLEGKAGNPHADSLRATLKSLISQ
ncbi:MAG: lipid-binding SYLF domain-containing protein [Alphaproteobacteria bacterium]|nr:lipid-binding SYLF domain-containing protein [Alphaproteobacteria bacterium]MBO6861045.1 lipid-binding SYLF domain-containing protein [Alphaproteobacteria bacterium]